MTELCKLFAVNSTADIPDGFIVERCSSYSDVLGDTVIYCREERKPDVIAWIDEHIKTNSDNIIKMFQNSPDTAIDFIKLANGITYLTEYFVDECGGVQAFLDMYCAHEVSEQQEPVEETAEEPVDDEDMGIIGGITLEEDGTEESAEELPVNESTEELPTETVTSEDETVVPEEVSSEESDVTATDEEILNVEEEEPDLMLSNPEPIEEESLEDIAEQLAESAPPEVSLPQFNVTEAEAGSIASKLLDELSQSREESLRLRAQASQMLTDVERKTQVLENNYGIIAKLFTPDGEFIGFQDETKYLEMLSTLKELDKRICIANIDPDAVLDKVELSKAVDYMGKISPVVYKMFFERLVSDAESDRDRMRVSALLNDFAEFVEEGCKTW